jgi:RNA polymerase sigma factor (sigma-70 family)
LMRGLRDRAPEAYAALYDRFAVGVHRFAVTRLRGEVQLAEDLVVETMAEAVRDIRRFDPQRSALSAWVYGIARRRVLQELRRQQRRKSVPPWAQVPMESVGEASDGGGLEASALSRLEAQREVAALSTLLAPMEMEALTLSCVEELSAREIGQVLGRSERAVHSILHRARTKARERLARDDG